MVRHGISAAVVAGGAILLAGCSTGSSSPRAAADTSASRPAADAADVADCKAAGRAYGPLVPALGQAEAPIVVGVVARNITVPQPASSTGTTTKDGAAASEAIVELGTSVAFIAASSPVTDAQVQQLQADVGAVRSACSALGVSVLG